MIIKVHIQPGAKRNEVVGMHGDALKIKLKAPPVDGKANAALIEFIAERLDISRSNVTIRAGHSSRQKLVSIEGHPDPISALTNLQT